MHKNAVLQVRAQELARSTRAFRARGGNVSRCEHCLLAQKDCICAARPTPQGKSAVCLLMYKGEAYKPSNSGRLIADVVADNHAFLWSRTDPDQALLALLEDRRYVPVLVFPHIYADPARCINTPAQLPGLACGRKPLFVFLDGTWREAKKMFKSSYLSSLPVLGIKPEKKSAYLMRDAAHLHQLCTAEVAVEVLALAGDNEAATALARYFSLFCEHYLLIKPRLLDKDRQGIA